MWCPTIDSGRSSVNLRQWFAGTQVEPRRGLIRERRSNAFRRSSSSRSTSGWTPLTSFPAWPTFTTGAIIFETLGGSYFDAHWKGDLGCLGLTTIEETLEMVVIVIFLHALLSFRELGRPVAGGPIDVRTFLALARRRLRGKRYCWNLSASPE